MAHKLDIAQNTYSKIEKDERRMKDDDPLYEKIAEVLGVSVDDIKSHTPIVMSFNNSQYNTPFGTQHNHFSNKIVEELINQLKTKDEQIARLMAR